MMELFKSNNLLKAAEKGETKRVEEILKQGANPNMTDDYQRDTQFFAIKNKDAQMLQIVLKAGGNPFGRAFRTSLTEKSLLEIIKPFLNYDEQIEQQMKPLHIAAMQGSIEHLELLIQNGFNINFQDENGLTPLLIATDKNQLEAMTFLLEKGANPNLTDRAGISPLVKSTQTTKLNDIKPRLELLVNHGANTEFIESEPFVIYIVKKGFFEILETVLKRGEDPNSTDKKGHTALMYAVESEELKAVSLLVKYGANIDIEDNKGEKAIQKLPFYKSLLIYELLNTKRG